MKKLFFFQLIILISFQVQARQISSSSADSIFADWNQQNEPGGAVAIVRDGEIIYTQGYGLADLEHDIVITPATVFYIGSVSKQFVTFSILLLEEQGKLHIDDNVQKYLTDFPQYEEPITIRQLIHHISGIKDFITLMESQGRSYLDHIEKQEVYELIKNQKELNFAPGERYLYSNSGYFLLSMIIEEASGMSLKEFAEQEIFIPLNMEKSQFYDDITDLVEDRAFSYSNNGTGFDNLVSRFDLVGSGGVYSTVEDFYRWDQNFYNNVLGKGNQSIIENMHEDGLLNNGKSSSYAFALINDSYKGLRTVSHKGSLAGYRAYYLRFPEQKFSVILFTNRDDSDASSKAYKIADLYLAEYLEE
ncbi:MAG: serine hydrolase domain-containing protein [Brumimicrobium sp.]